MACQLQSRTGRVSALGAQPTAIRPVVASRAAIASSAVLARQDLSSAQPSVSPYAPSSTSSAGTSQPARRPAAATATTPAAAALPDWALRFLRQVPSLPQGRGALEGLLHSTNSLLLAAAGSEHRAVLKAYCRLVLVDIVSAAWTQQATYLQMIEAATGPSPYCQQHLQQASSALCGCRYLRLEAVAQLAGALHTSLDAQGHCPDLDLSALPKSSEIGLSMPHLLTHGLGIDDLTHPAPKQQQAIVCADWDEYSAHAADASLCGDWSFCFWRGGASFAPAPFAKFSTAQLAGVLRSDVVLSSLQQGVWGRCLASAAEQAGLKLDTWGAADETDFIASALAAPAPAAGGAGSSAVAVDQLWRGLYRGSRIAAAERAVATVQQAVRATSASMAAAQLRQNVDSVLSGGAVQDAGVAATVEPVVARR